MLKKWSLMLALVFGCMVLSITVILLLYRPTPPQSSGTAPVERLAIGRTIGSENQFGRLVDFRACGDVFVIIDNLPIAADGMVLIVDKETGATVAHLGSKGEGPGEFLAPRRVTTRSCSDAGAWIYDYANAKLTAISGLAGEAGIGSEFGLPGPILSEPTWVTERSVVSNGHYPGDLLRFYRKSSDSGDLARTGTAGTPPRPHVAPSVQYHINRSSLALSPDGKTIALGFLYLSEIRYYDVEGTLISAVAGPVDIAPIYRSVPERTGTSAFHTDETRFAYVDMAASSSRVYALFSGRKDGDYDYGQAHAEEVHVFDWQGNLKAVWRLQREAIRIAVNEQGTRLYASGEVPYPSILEYIVENGQ